MEFSISIAVIAVLLVIIGIQAIPKRAPRIRKKRKKLEFSKFVLALVMLTYFFGVAIGAYIVLRSSVELNSLLMFIGAPVATAIGFYYWKAKNENMQKNAQSEQITINESEGDGL